MEILEEAVSLLRSSSARTWATYLMGAVPFSLGLLFFFTDMAQNPFAPERLAPEAFVMAVLFLWKSIWQAFFAARLYGHISDAGTVAGNVWRVVLMQCALQPIGGLLLLPASLLVLVFPLGWVLEFFRSVGLCAALGVADPIAAARRQASLWTKQNWLALGLVSAAAVLLFANIVLVLALLPQAGRSVLGIEGDFARAGMGVLNPFTFAVAVVVTWLIVDPLLEAVYVVRYFRGTSIATGEDLLVSLKKIVSVAALGLMLVLSGPQARAQAEPPGPAAQQIDTVRLNRSIDQVIRQREFAWREPKPEGPEPEGRWVGWVRAAQRSIQNFFEWVAKKLGEWFRVRQGADDERGAPAQGFTLEVWLASAALILLAALVVVWLRWRRTPETNSEGVVSAAPAPDVRDESVTADQLPESAWMQLSDELVGKGEFRLALRALYLAGLNFLSHAKLVTIHRSKTGREYRKELERMARAAPRVDAEINPAFANVTAAFDRGWYGSHAVERAEVEEFARQMKEIRRHASGA